MDESYEVFSVEDDPLMQEVIQLTLGDSCSVRAFKSAESCRQALADGARPTLFLLDVGLPGMDGYAFCQWLKSEESDFRDTPVIFVSSHDDIDARLNGYAAGGEDFIVKPFVRAELIEKVRVARLIAAQKKALREQAAAANQMTTLVMTNMAESGVILQFLRQIAAVTSARNVAEAMLQVLEYFQLKGAVQTRIGDVSHTQSQEGVDLPLEVSVIRHAREMGRIFEFRNRCVFNFGRITVMVNNMPVDNPDYCGRIRDHLAVAADGADNRLYSLEIEALRRRDQQGVTGAVRDIRGALASLGDIHQRNNVLTASLRYELDQEIATAFVKLGFSCGQEDFIAAMIHTYIERFARIFDRGEDERKMLEGLNQHLSALVESEKNETAGAAVSPPP